MITRVLRPSFWADATMAEVSPSVRLVYVGLWCYADDAGYLPISSEEGVYSVREVAAELFRFDPIRSREKEVQKAIRVLVEKGRVEVLGCGLHLLIPTLPEYRIKGGNHSFRYRERHRDRCLSPDKSRQVQTDPDKSVSVSVSPNGSSSGSSSGSRSDQKIEIPKEWASLGQSLGSRRRT